MGPRHGRRERIDNNADDVLPNDVVVANWVLDTSFRDHERGVDYYDHDGDSRRRRIRCCGGDDIRGRERPGLSRIAARVQGAGPVGDRDHRRPKGEAPRSLRTWWEQQGGSRGRGTVGDIGGDRGEFFTSL